MPVTTGYGWRRAISRGACSEACCGGGRGCRCQPGRRGSKVGTNAKKVVSRAFGGIFSGSKMEIPVNGCSTDGLEVWHEERDSPAFLVGNRSEERRVGQGSSTER